jgi:uncharacterized protein (DUF1684 family)
MVMRDGALSREDRHDVLWLLDWRRRIAALYDEIRSAASPADAHAVWQHERNHLFTTHRQSPVPHQRRQTFRLRVAPYDPRFRFRVPVDVDVAPARIEMPTSTGATVPFERLGVIHLPAVGDLDVWWLLSYGGGLFVPIKDASAGSTTYGGGRYIVDTAKGADLGGDDGHLVIDLNFAYHPSCAYDSSWVCPLAPPGNTVPVPVKAGELVREDLRDDHLGGHLGL